MRPRRALDGVCAVVASPGIADIYAAASGSHAVAVIASETTFAALDVDRNGVVSVSTDVVYVARRLLSLPPVPASFRAADPSIPPDGEIAARIDMLR